MKRVAHGFTELNFLSGTTTKSYPRDISLTSNSITATHHTSSTENLSTSLPGTMPPLPHPPDPGTPHNASNIEEDTVMTGSGNPIPLRPSGIPAASSLHAFLYNLLNDVSKRDEKGFVSLDPNIANLLMTLSAENERIMRRLEASNEQLSSALKRLTELERRVGIDLSAKSNAPDEPKSFAKITSLKPPGILPTPAILPPSVRSLASLKPKRVVIHSNPDSNTVKELPRACIVQRTNEALLKLDAKVDGEAIAVRGASVLPSGDVSFYLKNKAQQKWLMDNKHLWSKEVHPDLESTPSTFSVMAHGIPRSFDITKQANLNILASENSFQASELTRVCWMGSNKTAKKQDLLSCPS